MIAKFHGVEPQRCENIKGIVTPEIGPYSFGTLRYRPLIESCLSTNQDEPANQTKLSSLTLRKYSTLTNTPPTGEIWLERSRPYFLYTREPIIEQF